MVKSFRLFWNDKVAVGLTFIVPLVLMSIFGSIFGGSGSGPQGIRLAVLNNSDSPVAKRIEQTLDTTRAFRIFKTYKSEAGNEVKFDTTSIKEFVRSGNAIAGLVIPTDAYSDTSIGLKLKFYYDPKNEIEIQTAQGLLQQTIVSQLPQIFIRSAQRQAERFLGTGTGREFNRGIASLVSKYFRVDTSLVLNPRFSVNATSVDDTSGQTSNFFQNIVQIEKEQLVGKELKNPGATRSVGGWAMTFLLFSLTSAASSLFDEKRSGVMLRLLTSPVSRVHILWSKYLFNMSLGVLQLMFLFAAGWILFQIDIFSNFLNLMLIIVAAAIACTAFGMLLAAFSETRQQAQGLGTLLILTMSGLGGAWFPVSFMPQTFQVVSKFTIVYWSMDGFLQVLWRGVGVSGVLPHIGILLGISALVDTISVWQFKKGHVF